MNQFILLILAYLLFEREKKSNSNRGGNAYLGTETPYVYIPVQLTPPPHGYEPFYINHLGRHGARYLTGDTSIEEVDQLLKDGACKEMLTPEGYILMRQIEALENIEAGQYGLLTQSGIEMEQGIAKRMYERFPQVFGKKVDAVSTYVERTRQSMIAFLDELSRYTSAEHFEAHSNGKVDPILRFFDINKDYIQYKEDRKSVV